jgi:hypothetical protein
VTGVQTCALPIFASRAAPAARFLAVESLDAAVYSPATATSEATNFIVPFDALAGPVTGFSALLWQNAFNTNTPLFTFDAAYKWRFRFRAASPSGAAAPAAATAAAAVAAAPAAAIPAATAAAVSEYEQPQYLCLNKMYGCDPGVGGCWDEDMPATVTQASIDLLLAAVGGARGSAKRRLCFGWQFNPLDGSPVATKLASLDAALALALANDLPIVVTVDAFEFWQGRPDLFNWFDSSAPGFDPTNVANVEWTGPSPLNATAIAWCNWGAQFRKAPHPIAHAQPIGGMVKHVFFHHRLRIRIG